MKNILFTILSFFSFLSSASAQHITDTTPWYQTWIVGGEWVRDDTVTHGTIQKVFQLPPVTQNMNWFGAKIWIEINSGNGCKWSWENTDPTYQQMFTGGARIEHYLYIRGPGGTLQQIGHPGYRDMYPYGMGYDWPLQPFDGLVDGAGSSGWTNTCPDGIPGAESSLGFPACTLPNGMYNDSSQSYFRWFDLTPAQKRNFVDGAFVLYRPQLMFTENASHPWHNTHGWWNGTDVYTTVQLKFWVDNTP